jgi:electron transport complex protein RnfC
MPLPERLHVPLTQHIGAPAEAAIRIGQTVLKGELLGRALGSLSAAVHAPTSGTVLDVAPYPAPHPSGLPLLTVVIEPDRKDIWIDAPVPRDPLDVPPELIAERIAAAGIVGMGGATFPSAIKLGAAANKHIHTLIINGGECEPYLTCDDRLMQERAEQIVDGVRIILHAIRWGRALIAIENNKPEALAAMTEAARGIGNIDVVAVPSLYPMGSEKQLIRTLLGVEVPAGGLPAQVGVIVHNVATAYAVSQAIRHGHPLVSRVVTVGGAVSQRRNVEVAVGTLVQDLIDFCGGFSQPPARLLMGGPMMGQVLPHTRVPVVKGTSGILALTMNNLPETKAGPCIRCGSCVRACPMGLLPLEMAARIRRDKVKAALDFGLMDCIACGSCSYVCPSHIPLVHYFNFAKGQVTQDRARERKADEIRALSEAKMQRVEKETEAKKERARAAKEAREKAKAAQKEKTQ